MSLVDIWLQRRLRCHASPTASRSYQPWAETLEDRQCPTVAAPTGLQLTALSATQVKLTWNDVAGETGFKIYQWNGTASVLAGQTAQGVTTFTVNNLTPNEIQWFAVQAHDLATTAQSTWASVDTPAEAIAAPTNVKASAITSTGATLTWSSAAGESGYSIFQWNGTANVQIGSVGPTATSFKLQNLPPGMTNYFFVQAYNGTNLASSDWVTVTTPVLTMTAPTKLTATVGGTSSIKLAWKAGAGETGYNIYEWDGNENDAAAIVATLAASATTYQATALAPGQTYWFYVQAYNGPSTADSIWVDATTVSAVVLKPPTQLMATVAGPTSVNLSWVEPTGAAGYYVYVYSGSAWTLAKTVPAGTHNVLITGLTTGATHWFLVEAFTAGNVEHADSATVYANL